MMRYLAACGLFLTASAFAGDVDVRGTAAGRVSVHVTAAPLSEVLDRLARQTGMKVVYDGAPPRAVVVRGRQVEDATVADAVADVLEGLGVSYALRLDATGMKVDTLLVLGAVRASSPLPSSSAAARPAIPPVRLPGLGNVPAPPPDDDGDDEPSERAEEPSVDQRSGRGEERDRRPGPPTIMPTIPTFPVGPIGPLTMPTPAPAPSPQPTPPPQ
jgi:hypothetical protein